MPVRLIGEKWMSWKGRLAGKIGKRGGWRMSYERRGTNWVGRERLSGVSR